MSWGTNITVVTDRERELWKQLKELGFMPEFQYYEDAQPPMWKPVRFKKSNSYATVEIHNDGAVLSLHVIVPPKDVAKIGEVLNGLS